MLKVLFQVVLLLGLVQYDLTNSSSKLPNGWQQKGTVIQILFVGNSLTYSNDLPSLVVAEAKRAGYAVKAQMLASPNVALDDHWKNGQMQKLIASGQFDFVVIQQGPSSQAEGKQMLLNYGKKLSALCKKHEVTLAYFMVWPAKQNYHMFDGVIRNYTNAATITNSILCPVGKEWKEYFDRTGDFGYYSPDGFHPSLVGSTVAAEIIVQSLFKDKAATAK
ncbi:MAG: SGNH/GDSL hydrolase family protein [Cyclobacteriaceae bacterium]|nr:SGNH/GDSL hydrolase family protein [Cyclobacteriaceae bacterium]